MQNSLRLARFAHTSSLSGQLTSQFRGKCSRFLLENGRTITSKASSSSTSTTEKLSLFSRAAVSAVRANVDHHKYKRRLSSAPSVAIAAAGDASASLSTNSGSNISSSSNISSGGTNSILVRRIVRSSNNSSSLTEQWKREESTSSAAAAAAMKTVSSVEEAAEWEREQISHHGASAIHDRGEVVSLADAKTPFVVDGEEERGRPVVTYEILVLTGNYRGAGTNAQIRFALEGSLGKIEGLFPQCHIQRNSANVFKLRVNSLGDLKSLFLTHDNSGEGPDWFLSKVIVSLRHTGAAWIFPCEQWLDSEKGHSEVVLSSVSRSQLNAQQTSTPTPLLNGFVTCGAAQIPHPAKVAKGGEDAFFIGRLSRGSMVIGVADGVGDWAGRGVDAGIFSRMLMAECLMEAEREVTLDPLEILRRAWGNMHEPHSGQVKVEGSATACLMSFDGVNGLLRIANLGDSGLIVVRDGHLVFRTPQHEHFCGFPFQLSSKEGDRAEDAQEFALAVKGGDIIVMGSDGLFDNLHDEELAKTVWDLRLVHTPGVAEYLAQKAFDASIDRDADTPFSRVCSEELKLLHRGGKIDDITVIVAKIGIRRNTNSVIAA